MQTRYRCSHWPRGHSVGIVNDYTDTTKTELTLLANFEGFSQILKEQLGEKGVLGCVYFKNMKTYVSKEIFACPRGR